MACDSVKEESVSQLFEKQQSDQTGISFSNNLTQTEEFNIYTYRNFFNGGE